LHSTTLCDFYFSPTHLIFHSVNVAIKLLNGSQRVCLCTCVGMLAISDSTDTALLFIDRRKGCIVADAHRMINEQFETFFEI